MFFPLASIALSCAILPWNLIPPEVRLLAELVLFPRPACLHLLPRDFAFEGSEKQARTYASGRAKVVGDAPPPFSNCLRCLGVSAFANTVAAGARTCRASVEMPSNLGAPKNTAVHTRVHCKLEERIAPRHTLECKKIRCAYTRTKEFSATRNYGKRSSDGRDYGKRRVHLAAKKAEKEPCENGAQKLDTPGGFVEIGDTVVPTSYTGFGSGAVNQQCRDTRSCPASPPVCNPRQEVGLSIPSSLRPRTSRMRRVL